jgi:ketosteroid isomerase-like protein
MNRTRVACILAAVSVLPHALAAQQLPRDLASLVEAERSFSRASVARGIRASFIEFFAEEGVGFNPHPVKVKKDFSASPPDTALAPMILSWEPVYAGISRAGDLGFTTGPTTRTERASGRKMPGWGYYFSVWQKQRDGQWKVLADLGMGTLADSATPAFRAAQASPWPARAGPPDMQAERNALQNVEREFSTSARERGTAQAYDQVLADDARMHRVGVAPLTDKLAVIAHAARMRGPVSWQPITVDVARSLDLGYSYGKYEMTTATSGAAEETGYYVHVWRKDAAGKWKLIADIAQALAPGR